MSINQDARGRNVTAVLGPTNTGKTHLAIERMLGHETGLIGLPLRLLAREVYDKIVTRVGVDRVALVTGEEKIKPEGARYWVCTDFVAIDEVQLASDPERGHVFTDRLLHSRGRQETLLLGAGTMREAIADLIPGANFISRPRLSKLTYAGQKKITRLPGRTAVVAFSAAEVYAIAELIRRDTNVSSGSRVYSSTTVSTRNVRPSFIVWSLTKSHVHTSFLPVAARTCTAFFATPIALFFRRRRGTLNPCFRHNR